MPKEGRETASFLALIVDAATRDYEPPIKATDIKCLQKKCNGIIELAIDPKEEVIEWLCSDCEEAGRISGWENSKWDNRG